jgi:hypothetical protein
VPLVLGRAAVAEDRFEALKCSNGVFAPLLSHSGNDHCANVHFAARAALTMPRPPLSRDGDRICQSHWLIFPILCRPDFGDVGRSATIGYGLLWNGSLMASGRPRVECRALTVEGRQAELFERRNAHSTTATANPFHSCQRTSHSPADLNDRVRFRRDTEIGTNLWMSFAVEAAQDAIPTATGHCVTKDCSQNAITTLSFDILQSLNKSDRRSPVEFDSISTIPAAMFDVIWLWG